MKKPPGVSSYYMAHMFSYQKPFLTPSATFPLPPSEEVRAVMCTVLPLILALAH